jgi:hypothetical protein
MAFSTNILTKIMNFITLSTRQNFYSGKKTGIEKRGKNKECR